MPREWLPSQKRAVMKDFLRFFEDKKTTQSLKVKALQLIIIPMISQSLKAKRKIVRYSALHSSLTRPLPRLCMK